MISQHKSALFAACLAAGVALVAAPAQAGIISYQFALNYGNSGIAATSTAGVAPAKYWNVNTTSGTSGTIGGVVDSADDPTTVGGSYSSGFVVQMDGSNSTPNQQLFSGAIGEGWDGNAIPATVSLTSIPYASYNLIVYVQGNQKTGNSASVSLNGVTQFTGLNVNGADSSAGGSGGSPTFTPITASNQQGGNYLEFDNLTASSATVVLTEVNANDAGISGFQIVQAVPEPASLGLLGLGGLLVLTRGRRARA
jgi:hypothetical protein